VSNQSLKCKWCDHEALDLVPHIESKHADKGGLEAYMDEFNVDADDLVHPSIPELANSDAAKGKKMKGQFEVHGQKLPVQKGSNPFIPAENDCYVFPEFVGALAQDIQENRRVCLVGHTGCGKTSCIEQLAARTKNGFLKVNLNGQITVGDLVGTWTVKGGETVWIDGILPTAMKNGYWLCLDELDFGEPAIMAILNPVLEVGGKLHLKEKGNDIIEPHENFRIFGTGNTIGAMQDYRGLYQGTNIMNEAFLDRWRVFHVQYMSEAIEVEVLKKYIPKFTDRVAQRVVGVANMIREAFEKEEVSCTFSTRRLIDWSELLIRHRDPVKAAECSIFAKVSKEDAAIIKGIITRVMMGEEE
jgi:cobaltochelatase CobS